MQTNTRVLSIYLDHPKVGCGWRRFLVVKEGKKYATVICLENAEPLKLDMKELCSGKPIEFKPRRVEKRLRATARIYAREDSWAVKDAIKALKALPARVAA